MYSMYIIQHPRNKQSTIHGHSHSDPLCSVIIIITQTAAIALEPLTTHPDEWAEPLNVVYVHNIHIQAAIAVCCSIRILCCSGSHALSVTN